MLDHLFLSVSDIARSTVFYEAVLTPLGITARLDYDGSEDPPGPRLHYHPDYYAANALDPEGYSLEFVYKKWQHTS